MDNEKRTELANQYVELVDQKNALSDELEALRAIINHLITDNSTDIIHVEVLKVMKLSDVIENPNLPYGSKKSGLGFFMNMLVADLKDKTVTTVKLALDFTDADAISVLNILIKVKNRQIEAIEKKINSIDLENL